MRVILLIALALAGCQTTSPTLVECIFEAPEHVVEATTREGQRWADKTIEVGVRICGWPRPK